VGSLNWKGANNVGVEKSSKRRNRFAYRERCGGYGGGSEDMAARKEKEGGLRKKEREESQKRV